ncbi:unnamed protein product, partial [Amoebophrya sp. A120]|eukprot:GSA120T00005221001.1
MQRDQHALAKILVKYAEAMRSLQRTRRCLRLLQKGWTAHLLRELENPGGHGWSPAEYPEFLAFEVDNDLCIRENQAAVAFHMLESPAGNTLTQLNMGEGKSAVIMPIILAVAARPQSQNIVRATVLHSLYATNAAAWQNALGGVLGRRVHGLYCRRDLPLDAAEAKALRSLLLQVHKRGDVVVTVPEHRLSLENKAIELGSEESIHHDPDAAEKLLDVVDLLAKHGREFLDESDEILSPKYQLIYTLGASAEVDGGALRWAVHSAIIRSVGRHAKSLQEK